ncbi:hypothetical protein TIFTF001_029473 [Ficus carica]|uniref:Uncharacterized protein n=1 Tax=Ficus carica TaxID=3494 RepID=A0AA88DRJ7_FICCA|nr:hypothetical protein TIFTF001_029473 [Ficus carica]
MPVGGDWGPWGAPGAPARGWRQRPLPVGSSWRPLGVPDARWGAGAHLTLTWP